MRITTEARIVIQRPPAEVFDLSTDANGFPHVFPGYGMIPSVEKIEIEGGGKLKQGSVRFVHNSDKSVVQEEVLELKRPERHRYRLSGFSFPFSWLVKEGIGDWTFRKEGRSAAVLWTYDFELTTAVVYPLVRPIIRVFFRKAMERCLMAMRDRLES